MVIVQTFKLHGVHRAILEARYRQLEFLVQLGSDVNFEAKDGLKPLLRCCFVEKERMAMIMFRFLSSKGADVNCRDRLGRGVLTLAVLNEKPNLVKMLCRDDELNIIDRDKKGYTALHYASELGKLNSMNILISQMKRLNVDLDIQAHGGFTPLLCACRQGKVDAAELLIQNQASVSHMDYIEHRNAREWLEAVTRERINDRTRLNTRRPKTAYRESRETVRNETQNDSFEPTKFVPRIPPKSAVLPRGSRSAIEKRVTENRQLPSRAKSCPDLHKGQDAEEAFITELSISECSHRTENERVLCHLINSYGVQKKSSYRKSFTPKCSDDPNAKTWIQTPEKPQNEEPRPQTSMSGLKSRSKFQMAHDAVRAMLVMSRSSLSRQNSRSSMGRPGSAQSQRSGSEIFRRNKSKISLLIHTEPPVPE